MLTLWLFNDAVFDLELLSWNFGLVYLFCLLASDIAQCNFAWLAVVMLISSAYCVVHVHVLYRIPDSDTKRYYNACFFLQPSL